MLASNWSRPAVLALCILLRPTVAPAEEGPPRAEAEARVRRLTDEAAAAYTSGDYREARERAEEAVEAAEKSLGGEDPLLASALSWLGAARKALGDLAGARAVGERALAISEKTHGPDDPETARAHNNLGGVLRAMGDLAGARSHYERSLAIRERASGPDHPDTALALDNVAILLFQLGEIDEAQRRLDRALAIQEKALGRDSPSVAKTLDTMSVVARARGDLLGAKALAERVLAIDERSLGPDHPRTAGSMNGLAVVLQELGDLDAARPLLERAKALMEKKLGPDHPDVAASCTNLGYLARTDGDLDAARRMYERALAIREKALGPEHPETADSLNNLASLLMNLGDFSAARLLHERALRIHEKAFGPDHPRTSLSLVHAAVDARILGDRELARSRFERALKLQEAALGPDHPWVAWTLSEMSTLFRVSGDAEAAARCLDRAIGILERRLGAEHPDLAPMLADRTLVCRTMEERRALFERAYRIREKVLGPENPSTIASLSNLALTMWDMGEKEAAEPLLTRAWEADVRSMGTLLPALSSRDRQGFLRERASHLGGFLHVRREDPEGAWSGALVWKGAALRASAATLRAPAGAGEAERRVAEELYLARRALATFVLSPPGPRGAGPSIIEQAEALRKRVDDLERSLARMRPDLAEAMFASVSPSDVVRALPPRASLLDLLENQGVVHAWVARRGHPVEYHLLGDAAGIEALARRFRDSLEQDDEAAWRESGEALQKRIGAALVSAIEDAGTLYVSPDGALATIPWGLLPDGDGFLVERGPIVCVDGGVSLVRAQGDGDDSAAESMLALGGIDYTRLDRPFPALTETEREAELVARRFQAKFPDADCKVVTGEAGDEGLFCEEAPGSRYVHVATHGFFDLDGMRATIASSTRGISGKTSSPLGVSRAAGPDVAGWNPLLLSGLVLAPSEGCDGYVTAEELQDLDLRDVELVVLSACETGRGELAAGEGVLGLSRALAIAGARQFMLSLWKVPDAETAELMDAFYEGLWEEGLPAEEALRRAQLAMLARDRKKGVFRPSTWGAWVLTK